MITSDNKTYVLHAPIDGIMVALADVPDPAFSQELLGPGIAIEPLGDTLCAPAAGKVIQCAAALHAVTLELAPGVEILLHLGLDTVCLNGDGFEMLVREGQHIDTGTPLIRFDIDKVACAATSLVTPVVSIGEKKFHITAAARGRVSAGARLAALHPVEAAGQSEAGREAAMETTAQKQARVALENGLHARPASWLRQIGQRRKAKIVLSHKGREADAAHLTALLDLGLMPEDEVMITVTGPDAEKTACEIKKFLETPEGVAAALTQKPIKKQPDIKNGVLRAAVASPGCALGVLQLFTTALPQIAEQGKGAEAEKKDLLDAMRLLRERLQQAVQSSQPGSDQADILTAHIALLDDDALAQRALDFINKGKSAAAAWKITLDERMDSLAASANPLIRERGIDLRDLQLQLINLLLTHAPIDHGVDRKLANSIVLADELTPSQMIALANIKPAGVCLAAGGVTSHTAVLCRSAGIPCLAGLGGSLSDYSRFEGKMAIVDANRGVLEIAPSDERMRDAKKQIMNQAAADKRILAGTKAEAVSRDGVTIHVAANITSSTQAGDSLAMGADGIGLFRSEFLFLERGHAPSAEEQQAHYQLAVDTMQGRPVVIRMLDIGADKQLPWLKISNCANPALGIRGVRLVESHPELIETQLRALLQVRANRTADGKSALQIMLPMVSDSNDVMQIRKMMETLTRQMGLKDRKDFLMPQLGAMIEIPSAALVAGQLAQIVDFFSIGTNDLTQYSLAMDREEPNFSRRLDVLHPALLRLVFLCCKAARKNRCPVAVCGTAAGDDLAGPVFAALGVTKLSVEPQRIGPVKARLHAIDLDALRKQAKKALLLKDAAEVRDYLGAYLNNQHAV